MSEGWRGGWDVDRRNKAASARTLNPMELLEWLEDSITFAEQAGALDRDRLLRVADANRTLVLGIVQGIEAVDDVEAAHRALAMEWLRTTSDILRRASPATPSPHLVSYVLPVDPNAQEIFLGRHRLAGLWLPPGGHVEVGEQPSATAAREFREEAAEPAVPDGDSWLPHFLTWNHTRGPDPHVADAAHSFQLDENEFADERWWSAAEVLASPPDVLEPNLPRFVTKLWPIC